VRNIFIFGCFAIVYAFGPPVFAYQGLLFSDTYVDTTVATPPNNGMATSLVVSGNGSHSLDEALFKFTLANLPSGTTSSQVVKATLTVFINQVAFTSGSSGTVYLCPVYSGIWNEAVAPTISGTANSGGPQLVIGDPIASATFTSGTSTTQSSAGTYITFDVTSRVQTWLSTPSSNQGLEIKIFSSDATLNLDSKESTGTSHPASLDITLSTVPTGTVPLVALPQTTSSTAGVLSIDNEPFLHAYGSENTFVGAGSGNFTLTGSENAGMGTDALASLTTGAENLAMGSGALPANTAGGQNVALGASALSSNILGNYNVAAGFSALGSATGSSNTAVGDSAGSSITTGSNNIDIGSGVTGTATDSGVIRIGAPATATAAYFAGIYNVTSSSGVPVYINSNGQLGTLTSSRRFKDDIQNMGSVSDVLLALQPVTYHYKPQIDPAATPQFGLVAEDVAKVDPDLVIRDKDGAPYTVRYDAVNAMLLNEFLKEHRQVQMQKDQLETLKSQIESDAARLAEQQKRFEKMAVRLHALEAPAQGDK
jgi:hypothetical protein